MTTTPKPKVRHILIQIIDGSIEIIENGLTTEQLGWDEMLGQIAVMTMPDKIRSSNVIYPMKTQQEWDKQFKRDGDTE